MTFGLSSDRWYEVGLFMALYKYNKETFISLSHLVAQLGFWRSGWEIVMVAHKRSDEFKTNTNTYWLIFFFFFAQYDVKY